MLPYKIFIHEAKLPSKAYKLHTSAMAIMFLHSLYGQK